LGAQAKWNTAQEEQALREQHGGWQLKDEQSQSQQQQRRRSRSLSPRPSEPFSSSSGNDMDDGVVMSPNDRRSASAMRPGWGGAHGAHWDPSVKAVSASAQVHGLEHSCVNTKATSASLWALHPSPRRVILSFV